MPGARAPSWNGLTKLVIKIAAVAAALATMIGLGTQLDARYARAAEVKAIQSDILELSRDGLYREWLELGREAAKRPLSQLERERVDKLLHILKQIDERLNQAGRSP